MRVPFIRLAAAGLLVLAAAAPAYATSGRVAIVLHADFTTGVETFTATGAFCSAGSAVTTSDRFGGRWRAGSFHVTKVLTCTGGADSLTIDVNAATVFGSPQDQGGWSVVGGTGAYASANGGGNVVGDYDATGVEDHYAGVVFP